MDQVVAKIKEMELVMPTDEEIDRRIEELDIERLKELAISKWVTGVTLPAVIIDNKLVDAKGETYPLTKIGLISYFWLNGLSYCIPDDIEYTDQDKEWLMPHVKLYRHQVYKVLEETRKEYLLGFIAGYLASVNPEMVRIWAGGINANVDINETIRQIMNRLSTKPLLAIQGYIVMREGLWNTYCQAHI